MSNTYIFDNAYKTVRNITANAVVATWRFAGSNTEPGTGKSLPLFMTGISMQFGRSVAPQYILNADAEKSDMQLNIVGRPAGTLTIQSIMTAYHSDLEAFLRAVGATCASADKSVIIDLMPVSGQCGSHEMCGYRCLGVTLSTLGINIQGGAMAVISDNTSYQFSNLEIIPPTSK